MNPGQIFTESAHIDMLNMGVLAPQEIKTLDPFLPKQTHDGKPRKVFTHCKCGEPLPNAPFKYMGICAICDLN